MSETPDLTFDGITQPISEWALDYGIPANTIRKRLNRGWTVERAITTPVDHLATLPDDFARPRKPTKPQRTGSGLTITCGDRTMTVFEWADHLGIPHQTIRWRLRQGWPAEKVLSTHHFTSGRRIEHDGEVLTVREWADRLGILDTSLHHRLRRMPATKAVATPVRRRRSKTDLIEFGGVTMTLPQWADHLGIPYPTLWKRKADGWTVERMLTEPVADVGEPLSYQGVTRSMTGWAATTGIPSTTLRSRRQLGWPVDRMLTEPARPRRPRQAPHP